MKSFLKKIFNRLVFAILFMLLQIGVLVLALEYFRAHFFAIYAVFELLSVVFVIKIVSGNTNPAYKMAWIIPILALPVFGSLMYLLGRQYMTRAQREKLRHTKEKAAAAMELAESEPPKPGTSAARQSSYIRVASGSPCRGHTETEFLSPGETMFKSMLEEIEKAEKYIFAEYFILEEGEMLTAFLDALRRKAAEGVDVRLVYDDLGSIRRVPDNFPAILKKDGIDCRVFRRFMPVLSGSFNTRDHRKILVVDGVTAFTGGINIADEYINRARRFGHWQDCGVRLHGSAAWNLTVAFLAMWEHLADSDEDYASFFPGGELYAEIPEDGRVQPYTDEPVDEEPVGENTYIGLISKARRYVWITTPYLVIDNEMNSALCRAAKGGVDVRIMTPGIPDKKYVYVVTRSHYRRLLNAGVRIFEYTPGFLHSKVCVADDEYAVCGTINFDYRSLYLHHECAVWMHLSRAVGQIKESYDALLPKCREMTREWCDKTPWYVILGQELLRVFSPLM